ncbi:MAG: T9SS type A sorting domain-containing protein [Bacteroidales bacterium]|nr:T9SS type A sorting domain-containing protein [Bacteroidales bacterium]
MVLVGTVGALLLLSVSTICAQSITYTYYYDDCGNRYSRTSDELTSKIDNTSNSYSEKASTEESPHIEIIKDIKVSFYPNPTEGALYLELSNLKTETTGEMRITALDGKILMIEPLNEATYIDLKEFADGIYLLQIQIDNEVNTYRIIKQQ